LEADIKEIKLAVTNTTWLALGLCLLALFIMYFIIPGQNPTEQFFKGLMAGSGSGVSLVGVYLLFGSRSANGGSSQK
jgi:hypothetical protein